MPKYTNGIKINGPKKTDVKGIRSTGTVGVPHIKILPKK